MEINKIVIHCTATPNGRETTAADIHRWHLERGWSGIGYHYVIKTDGTVESGRPEYWQGAHASGHNKGSIGIAMVGTDSFDEKQWSSLQDLVDSIAVKHGLNLFTDVIGHNEVSNKTCPGFNVREWLEVTFHENPKV